MGSGTPMVFEAFGSATTTTVIEKLTIGTLPLSKSWKEVVLKGTSANASVGMGKEPDVNVIASEELLEALKECFVGKLVQAAEASKVSDFLVKEGIFSIKATLWEGTLSFSKEKGTRRWWTC
ncbi:unnamed protein product [Lupinus luteus]|uniref:Uncharacterized protein n=1 Tax=Lupinus luteus TaxID=3873 RepID=A0AAV1YLZ9_LUPLU